MKQLAPLALTLTPFLGLLFGPPAAQRTRLASGEPTRFVVPPTLRLCDSYGKVWLLNFTLDPLVEGGYGVDGFNDLQGFLPCSNVPLPVFGSLVDRVLSITSFDDPDSPDGCVSVHWRGTFDTDLSLDGRWMNERLSIGTFSFMLCPTEHTPAIHAAQAAGRIPPSAR